MRVCACVCVCVCVRARTVCVHLVRVQDEDHLILWVLHPKAMRYAQNCARISQGSDGAAPIIANALNLPIPPGGASHRSLYIALRPSGDIESQPEKEDFFAAGSSRKC